MAAYLITRIHVTDPAKYEGYKAAVPAAIKQYGGKYLTRGGQIETLEGAADNSRTVVLEFASAEQARKFWQSPEYAHCKSLRAGAASMQAVIVEGI